MRSWRQSDHDGTLDCTTTQVQALALGQPTADTIEEGKKRKAAMTLAASLSFPPVRGEACPKTLPRSCNRVTTGRSTSHTSFLSRSPPRRRLRKWQSHSSDDAMLAPLFPVCFFHRSSVQKVLNYYVSINLSKCLI
jgi:hypothetical protein